MNNDENKEVKKRRRAGANVNYEVFTENKDQIKKEKPIDITKIKKEETIKKEQKDSKNEVAKKEDIAKVPTKVQTINNEKKQTVIPQTKKEEKKIATESKNVKNNEEKINKANSKAKQNKPKTPLNKKQKIILGILIFLYILLLSSVTFAGSFLGKKMALLDFEDIDKSDLGIEENVFDGANMNLTKAQFDQIKTIAVFGTDNRANSDENSRSDVNMVLSINPNTKSIKMISVPRDTYVQINGSKDKMCHAYFYGGPQLAIKTLNQNFGLNITEYATIDFYGVINAINKIGGVEIDITQAERDYINKWTKESYGFSGRPYEELTAFGEKTLLNGEQALAHARNRTIGNDFSRAERQRVVLTAMLNKLATMNLDKVMELVDTILTEIKTNINVLEYTKFLPELYNSKDQYLNNIISKQVPETNDIRFQTINGLSCVVTDLTKQKEIFRNYIYNM